MNSSAISIIVPAYNEELSITDVVTALKATRPRDEMLVVDDASEDETGKRAKEAGARVIRHP